MKKIFFIFSLLILFYSLFFVHFALADYKIEVAIPGGPAAETPVALTDYIRYIYMFGLSLVGVTALGALVYGGFTYMLSDTITSKDDAKQYIKGAISGLILALASYLILNTINPDLVSLKEPCSLGNCPAKCVITCGAGYTWNSSSCQCKSTAAPPEAVPPEATCTASNCPASCQGSCDDEWWSQALCSCTNP